MHSGAITKARHYLQCLLHGTYQLACSTFTRILYIHIHVPDLGGTAVVPLLCQHQKNILGCKDEITNSRTQPWCSCHDNYDQHIQQNYPYKTKDSVDSSPAASDSQICARVYTLAHICWSGCRWSKLLRDYTTILPLDAKP